MSQISDYMHDQEVRKVQLLCENPERYAIRFDDGSAMLTDGEGNRINSPLSNYDFITKVEYIGRMNDVPHFAFEGCEYASRHFPDTGMFDADGHRTLFRDPRTAGLDGVEYIKWEFERLEKLANDPTNPHRNDPVLIDLDEQQNLSMKR